ncbi:hypothetical protein [Streptomyces sp. CA-106110]|uniref:hypothetical protein n=1 Tax=Streptomyces sp. CA-106110 TaxID=3240044 RepID=UPI003D9260F1
MTTAYSEPSTGRTPGRAWTIRITGHSDRSATVSCSTGGCQMPPRSKNVAALRAFAAQHAAAHARAARVRPDAHCHCRADGCAAHEAAKVSCAGAVVLIVRHDAAVGRVWSVEEVCQTCAALIPNAAVHARAARPAPTASAHTVPAPARSSVPGGFSSPGAEADSGREAVARPRRAPRGGRRSPRGQAH